MLNRKNRTLLIAIFALALVMSWGASPWAFAGSPAAEASEQAAANETTTMDAPPLDGGQVYGWTCGSCHSERRPRERTDAEWEVITMHMRVRANLTAAQTQAVLDYLKENN